MQSLQASEKEDTMYLHIMHIAYARIFRNFKSLLKYLQGIAGRLPPATYALVAVVLRFWVVADNPPDKSAGFVIQG